ncbi:MAG: hypothetical protein QOG00_2382 [Pyrinomonadaceae bacterium]|nr:hypothetical protein [Pyrinomonadaceae bacterium]
MTEESSGRESPHQRNAPPVRVIIDGMGHPLVLLIIGSLLTYIVAPMLIDTINEKKLKQEARQQQALGIWKHNTEFNSKLNALKTMLESYHNQNVRFQLGADDLAEAQKEFRREFTRRYLELDEIAWWWYRDLERELIDLKIVPENQVARLDADLNLYGENVNKSVALLRPIWQALTSREYQPADEKTQTRFTELRNKADAELPRLFNERSDIIRDVTGVITASR